MLGDKSLFAQHRLLVGLDEFLKQLLTVACLLGTSSSVGQRLFGPLPVALLCLVIQACLFFVACFAHTSYMCVPIVYRILNILLLGMLIDDLEENCYYRCEKDY